MKRVNLVLRISLALNFLILLHYQFQGSRFGEARLQPDGGEEHRFTAHCDHRIEFGRHRRPRAGRGSVGGRQQGHHHVG